MASIAIAALLGYALGSITPGAVVARRAGIDIRRAGSGGTGGTNVARSLGWKIGLAVVAVDALKGFLAFQLAGRFLAGSNGPHEQVLGLVAGMAACLGHVWPVFASFRGGKGVATTAGVLLAAAPGVLGIALALFVAVLAMTRIVSLASVTAALSVPVVLAILRWTTSRPVSTPLLAFGLLSAALILLAHRSNLARIRSGTEPTAPP